MYSQDKINIALQVYHQCESVTVTINVLKKRRHRHGVLEEQIKGSDGHCPER